MSVVARDLFRGFDWITQNESVATALGTLDAIQELCSPLPADELCLAARLVTISSHCEDFETELDMLSADLNVFTLGRISARWAVQESRLVLGAFASGIRTQLVIADKNSNCLDLDVSMRFTQIVLRLKDLIRTIEA